MKISGAELIVRILENHGIDIVSGIPGGSNLPLYDALSRSKVITHVLPRHEQAAGFIAQGMARSTGKTAVCIATSGPGATNLITAIADAKLDSVPIVAITGQVPGPMIGTDAFQEVDVYGMTIPITKHNFLVRSAREIIEVLPEAFRIASSGRPGPVVVDVPKDVQVEQIEIETVPVAIGTVKKEADYFYLEKAAEMINKSVRPIIYAGGGVISSSSCGELLELAKKSGIPVSVSLMGIGAFPPDDPLYLGMVGMHGAPYTNYALDEADLLIALGTRFDDRATGRVREFCPKAEILHFDVDSSEIGKIKRPEMSVICDLKPALKKLIPLVRSNAREDWSGRIIELKRTHPSVHPETADLMHPVNVINEIVRFSDGSEYVTTDVGQHQMWTAQLYPVRKPRNLLTSGGLGTMGFGLPAAIGAALADRKRRVICISGDGSIQMNIQEFATLEELGLNVKVFIFNNGYLGLVRQQQELFYGGNYFASKFPKKINFAGIASAYGIKSIKVSEEDHLSVSIEDALKYDGPVIVDIDVHCEENVFPMVPPGAANRDMIRREKYEEHSN